MCAHRSEGGLMYDSLLARYRIGLPALTRLQEEVATQLNPLRTDPAVHVHTVSHRLKTEASLRGKLARPDRTYAALTDVTDLLGFRVVTYFDDGVEAAARFVEKRFDVDLAHSVDKRGREAADRFGYRSLHYVCRPPGVLAPTLEEAGLQDVRFELQIRTILQHTWAEIEHDLGYKAEAAIPLVVRRRFSRLAGLLELADEEFLGIKRDLVAHRAELQDRIVHGQEAVRVDVESLRAWLDTPPGRSLDERLARHLDLDTSPVWFYPEYLVQMLGDVGLDTIALLARAAESGLPQLPDLVDAYFAFAGPAFGLTPESTGPVKRGYALLFLAHAALARSESLEVELVERAARFFGALDYPNDPDEARRVAVAFVRCVRGHAGRALKEA